MLITTVILSAPAASASQENRNSLAQQSAGLSAPETSFHLLTNSDNQRVGLAYPGVGHQAIVSTSPGSTSVTYISGSNVWFVVHNSNGNCLRMRDASYVYAVMEEKGCNPSDSQEQFQWLQSDVSDVRALQNRGTGYVLGVEPCPAENNAKVFGESGASGQCDNWVLK
jgi:hypothetical protein